MRTNLNEVARRITLQEGGKVSLSIAQVKEVMRLTLQWLAGMSPVAYNGILKRYRPHGRSA
jgi:hypothetical protein